MKFRKLKADEIDARVATVKETGCSLLLYKDARVDQNILDETVGAENWQRSHQLIGSNLYCTVSLFDEKKNIWVSKQDVGTESYTEKEKGQASDSFKRACFNWGIGRELYTAPFIWVKADKCNLKPNGNKYTTYDKFTVQEIGYDKDGNINQLKIYNETLKKIAFTMGDKSNNVPETTESQEDIENNAMLAKGEEVIDATKILSLKKVCKNHKMPEEKLAAKYGKTKIEEMTVTDYREFAKTGEEFLKKWDKANAG